MSEQPDPAEEEVRSLLEQAKRGDECCQELAFDLLRKFAGECSIILSWQKTDGRQLVLLGADPDEIKARTLERIDEARERLRSALVKLLAWANEAGRIS